MDFHGPRRFVVQQHELSADRHWDLMLEQDEALATWQLTVPPELAAANSVTARRLADHRKAYLQFEGPVSNDRGRVHIVDGGTYVLLGADEDEWRIEFAGHALQGLYRLLRTAPESDLWLLQSVSP